MKKKNKMRWPSVNARRKAELNKAKDKLKQDSISKNANDAVSPPKSDNRWVEQWDIEHIMTENVDISSSQASFAVPLVELAISRNLHIGLQLSYNSNEADDFGLIGNGWAIEVPQEYITLDEKGTVLSDRHEYFYVLGSQIFTLIKVKETGGITHFKLLEDEDVTFAYDAVNQRWIVESEGIRSVFGKGEDAVSASVLQESLGWPNWREQGTDEYSLNTVIVGWYLVSREDKYSGTKLLYEYYTEKSSTALGKQYTTVIQLQKIRDSTGSSTLTLEYGVKDRTEYSVQHYKNFEGTIQFPVYLEDKLFVKGYHLETEGSHQLVRFDYNTDMNSHRLLQGVRQIFQACEGEERIFEMVYVSIGDKILLQELKIGPQKSIKYSYTQLNLPVLDYGELGNIIKYATTENVQISVEEDYSVIAHNIGVGRIHARIYNRQLMLFEKELTTNPRGENRKIESFALVLFAGFFAILEETENNKVLTLFKKDTEKNEWSDEIVELRFAKDSIFRYNTDIMVVANADQNKLTIVEPNEEETFHIEDVIRIGIVQRMVVDEKVILGYDENHQVFLAYKNEGGSWQTHTILEVESDEEAFLGRFRFENDFKKYFLTQIRTFGLQMSKSVASITSVRYYGSIYFVQVHLIELNSNYQLLWHSIFDVIDPKDILTTTKVVQQSGSDMYFRYIKEDDEEKMFVGELYDAKGEIDEKIEAECKGECSDEDKRMMKEKIIKQMNEENKEMFQKLVLFETEPFITFKLDSAGLTTNSSRYDMTGEVWYKHAISNITFTPVAKDLVLKVEGTEQREFSLFLQNPESGGPIGLPIYSAKVSSNGTFVLGYPSYVAHQEQDKDQVQIYPFENKSLGNKITLPKGELLLQMSNSEMILTMRNNSDSSQFPRDKELLIRKVETLLPSVPALVVSRSEVSSGEYSRIRGFEHAFEFDAETLSQRNIIRVIPMGNKTFAGWYEEVTTIPITNPRLAQKHQVWYNSAGEQVQSSIISDQDGEEEEEDSSWFKILSNTGDLLLSDTSPYNITDNMIAYYGFEEYEKVPKTGEDNGWIIDGSVILDEISFTGERFLRLRESDKIEVKITPSDQSTTFVGSTWVRCSQLQYEFGKPVDAFKTYVQTKSGNFSLGFYGQMKQRHNDWIYLESTIDLHQISTNVLAPFRRENSKSDPINDNLTISLQICAENLSGVHLDIDHVRFIPIQQNQLKFAVYQTKTGLKTEEILFNGAVLRKIYNKYYEEIGTVDNQGYVEQLKSGSRSGYIHSKPEVIPVSVFNTAAAIRSDLIFNPSGGIYEWWDLHSQETNWKIENKDAWNFSKGRVQHKGSESDTIALSNKELVAQFGHAIRFYFWIPTPISSIEIQSKNNEPLVRLFDSSSAEGIKLEVPFATAHKKIINLPTHGELIVFLKDNFLWLWFDGVLLVDTNLNSELQNPTNEFILQIGGETILADLIVLKDPELQIEYYNAWGDHVQLVQLENEDTVVVTETIYDEIGREAIKTKATRISRFSNESAPLLHFHDDFVTNKHPNKPDSVFSTGIMTGKISQEFPEDEGYPYSRTSFFKDMLRMPEIEGLPGKDFAISSSFTKRHFRRSDLQFIEILFPRKDGFTEQVTMEPNGNKKVIVLDTRGNEIAEYISVDGYDHILITHEYDSNNRLLMTLPPNYHAEANTYGRLDPWPVGKPEDFTETEIELQGKLGTHYKYNDLGQLVYKKSPDESTREFIYDTVGNIRFMYNVDPKTGNATNVISILSIAKNRPVEISFLETSIKIETLKSLQNSTSIPGQSIYQQINYSDLHSDPSVRGNAKLFLTYNPDPMFSTTNSAPHMEVLTFNGENKLTMKTSDSVHSNGFEHIRKIYDAGNLRELQYPKATNSTQPLNLVQNHKSGMVTQIATRDRNVPIAAFSYSSAGQITTESLEPGATYGLNRTYAYNSPGMLTTTSDPFFSESVSYTSIGYGQRGWGDGIIMKNIFKADWTQNLQPHQEEWFRIPEEQFQDDKLFKMCIQALKRIGVVNEDTGIPLTPLTMKRLFELPLPCHGSLGHTLMQLVNSFVLPSQHYGHLYAYGNHQELVRAKDVSDGDGVEPLQIKTLYDRIPEVESLEEAEAIWDLLQTQGFLISDQPGNDKLSAIGRTGYKSIFNVENLKNDLEEIDLLSVPFALPILKMQFKRVLEDEEKIPVADFKNLYVELLGYRDTPTSTIIINQAKRIAQSIYEMLEEKGYLSGNLEHIVHPQILEMFEPIYISNLIDVLHTHFSNEIGTSTLDFESFEIDPNGNRKMFYNGLSKHECEYEYGTNRITKLRVYEPYSDSEEAVKEYEFEHDLRGNVVRAESMNIKSILYHPVTNRPILIEMSSGVKLIFKYDALGERILKRCFGADGVLQSEVKYVRDEQGQVIQDTRTTFTVGRREAIHTDYIYGPRGLLGFIRNEKFHSVFTDHSGSVRLIMCKGEVVYGYDYLPYGKLSREYGDKTSNMYYLYTGQEYDEETGLYNFHSRLYDPVIGRFFQPDPKSQYSSPYIYAGNSPISFADPDGEFFFTLAILAALVGAFLGGAAANGSWNPLDWNWKDKNTWFGILGGAAAGAALPSGMLAAVEAIGLPATLLAGLGMTYVTMIPGNGWNPGKWKWKSPNLYNSFFQGFSSSVGLIPGLKSGFGKIGSKLKDFKSIGFLKTISQIGQKQILQFAAGVAVAYLKGAAANGFNFKIHEWDWKDPATYASLLEGFSDGKKVPSKVHGKYKSISKLAKKDMKQMMKNFKPATKEFFKDTLKNKHHPLYKIVATAVVGYVNLSLAAGSFDITKWDWKSLSTYEGLLNSMRNSVDVVDLIQDARQKNMDNIGKLFTPEAKNEMYKEVDKSVENQKIVFNFFELIKASAYTIPFINSMDGEDLNEIVNGLFGNDFIYLIGEPPNFLDCSSLNFATSEFNSTKCSIMSNSPLKYNLQMKETVHYLPVPTYEATSTEFVSIKQKSVPSGFLDFLLDSIMEIPEMFNAEFLSSFTSGSLFNSLLNIKGGNMTVLIASDFPANFPCPVLHVGIISENKLELRSILIADDELTSELPMILEYVENQDFICKLPKDFNGSIEINSLEIWVMHEKSKLKEILVSKPRLSSQVSSSLSNLTFCDEAPSWRFLDIVPRSFDEFDDIFDNLDFLLKQPEDDKLVGTYHQFMTNLVKIYEDMTTALGLENSVSSFNGFFYGMLYSNARLTYNLQISMTVDHTLSFFAGRSGNLEMKSFFSVPFTVKHGTTQSDVFTHSFFTLSSSTFQAVLDLSSNFVEVERHPLTRFSGTLANLSQEDLFLKEIKSLYHFLKSLPSISLELSINSHIISNFVLGEFLSFGSNNTSNLKLFAYSPVDPEEESRLSWQRIYFVVDMVSRNATVFNIIESSKLTPEGIPVFDPPIQTNIPSIPDIPELQTLVHVQIQLNTRSTYGWSPSDSATIDQDYFFFQDITSLEIDASELPKSNSSYVILETVLDSLAFDVESLTSMFQEMSADRFRSFVLSEADFQSLMHGFLVGKTLYTQPDLDGFSLGLANRIDNLNHSRISTHELVTRSDKNLVLPQSEKVLVSNLKYTTEVSESEISSKVEGGERELDAFSCKNIISLTDFVRVSAIYSPKSSNGITAKFNSTSFKENDTCSYNSSNLFGSAYPNVNLRTSENSASSAAKADLFFPARIFKDAYKFLTGTVSSLFGKRGKENINEDTKENFKPSHNSITQNCQIGAWNDDKYNNDGITCLNSDSKVMVFPKIQSNDIFGGYDSVVGIFGDTYDTNDCSPIEFNHLPSVACTGDKTTFVYTPFLQERLFDNVDGNILLARVLLHLGGNILSAPSVSDGSIWSEHDNVVEVPLEIFSAWEKSLAKIKNVIQSCNETNMKEIGWAKLALEDIQNIILEVSKNKMWASQDTISDVSERLSAILEDVTEQIEQIEVYNITRDEVQTKKAHISRFIQEVLETSQSFSANSLNKFYPLHYELRRGVQPRNE